MISWKRITLLGGLTFALVAVFHPAFQFSRRDPAPSPPDTPPAPAATRPPADPLVLAERMEPLGNLQPTPKQLESKRQYNRTQALAISGRLNDPDLEKRIETLQQLGAYPGAEAEELLTQTLLGDTHPRVRVYAARTLDTLEKPTPRAISVLLQAIGDPAPEVQQASLLTLEYFLNKPLATALRERIVRGLEDESHNQRLAGETQAYLQALLAGAQHRRR